MGSVTGRVVDTSGTGVAGCWVYAYPVDGARFGTTAGTHSDLVGRYRLELAPGTWKIRETGHQAYEITVGATDLTTETPAESQVAVVPSADDFRRRLGRRRSRSTGEK